MKPPKILIYTTSLCPYCQAAKDLLRRKGAAFEEIDVSADPKARQQMRTKAHGQNTVPQIWIGDTHVGGCDDLYALEGQGRLEGMLGR